MNHLGIDIAKVSFEIVLLRDGQTGEHAQFSNDKAGFKKLKVWLEHRQVDSLHACMEATGNFSDALATFLYEQENTVSVVNPARISGYAQSQMRRNKTDKLDALLIAEFCRSQKPPAWTPPDPAWKELQAMIRHLQDLEKSRQQARNRLSGGTNSAIVSAQLHDQVAFLDNQIAELKKRIHDHIDQHPTLKQQRDLLSSIPGIGDLTASKLLGEFRSIPDFDHPNQLVAFAGLNPRHHSSGSSIRGKTAISKQGRSSIRAALYMPAVVAKRFNPKLAAFAARLKAKGLSGTQIVVAVMRKLLHLAFGVLKSNTPFDFNFVS